MNVLSEMLSYPFMVRALFGGMLVSLCALPFGSEPGVKTLFHDR